MHPHRIRQEFFLLPDVFGLSAAVDALNSPPVKNATYSSVLGPFFKDDVPDDQFNSAPSLSPSALSLSIMRRDVHSPARRVDRVEMEYRVHVCWG